jgi:hypothetical protein
METEKIPACSLKGGLRMQNRWLKKFKDTKDFLECCTACLWTGAEFKKSQPVAIEITWDFQEELYVESFCIVNPYGFAISNNYLRRTMSVGDLLIAKFAGTKFNGWPLEQLLVDQD